MFIEKLHIVLVLSALICTARWWPKHAVADSYPPSLAINVEISTSSWLKNCILYQLICFNMYNLMMANMLAETCSCWYLPTIASYKCRDLNIKLIEKLHILLVLSTLVCTTWWWPPWWLKHAVADSYPTSLAINVKISTSGWSKNCIFY